MPSHFGLENEAPCGIDVTQRNGCGQEYSFLVPVLPFDRPVRPLYNNQTYDQIITISRQADSTYNERTYWDR